MSGRTSIGAHVRGHFGLDVGIDTLSTDHLPATPPVLTEEETS